MRRSSDLSRALWQRRAAPLTLRFITSSFSSTRTLSSPSVLLRHSLTLPAAAAPALRRPLATQSGAPVSTKGAASPVSPAPNDDEEDFTKLGKRSLFEDRLKALEHTGEAVAPRKLANLLRAMILGRRQKLTEFEPRVLALHPRVRGGTKLDGAAVLAALSHIGNLEATFAEYERLRNENIKSFELNYGYLVEVSSAKGQLTKAFSVVDLMRRDRHLLVETKPSTFVFNRLILACGKNHRLERAIRAFELMHEEGLRPTPTSFAAYIDACAMTADFRSGLKVLSQMKRILRLAPEKYQLDASYYTGLIPACSDPQDFDRIVAEMIREDIKPTEETLAALIRDCATNGGLSRALEMFKELRLFQQVTQQQQQQTDQNALAEERRKVVRKPSLLGSIYF